MNERIIKSIEKNKGILRQLTYLNNEVKELKSKVKVLEQRDNNYPNQAELTRMAKCEGTD